MAVNYTADGIPIVDDRTDLRSFGKSLREHAGYERRDYQASPVGGGPYAKAWRGPRLSVAERKELIKERERTKSRISDLMTLHGVKPFHQAQTSSCWAQSTVFAFGLADLKARGVWVPFSAASVAGRVTGFRDVGGWCSKALDLMVSDGVATQNTWSPNAVTSRKSDNAESQAERKLYRPTEYDDFEPNDTESVIDFILTTGFPVAIAAMWMRHAVVWSDPYIASNGSIGVKGPNSGYLRDANGWTAFEGRRVTFDEAVAVRVTTL